MLPVKGEEAEAKGYHRAGRWQPVLTSSGCAPGDLRRKTADQLLPGDPRPPAAEQVPSQLPSPSTWAGAAAWRGQGPQPGVPRGSSRNAARGGVGAVLSGRRPRPLGTLALLPNGCSHEFDFGPQRHGRVLPLRAGSRRGLRAPIRPAGRAVEARAPLWAGPGRAGPGEPEAAAGSRPAGAPPGPRSRAGRTDPAPPRARPAGLRDVAAAPASGAPKATSCPPWAALSACGRGSPGNGGGVRVGRRGRGPWDRTRV